MAIIYTAKRAKQYTNGWEATMLEDGASTAKPVEYPGFESLSEVKEVMTARYPDSVMVGTNKFAVVLASRQTHSAETLKMLRDNYMQEDYSNYCVYASFMRPISGSWARIDGAIFINTPSYWVGMKPHTLVVVPVTLSSEIVEKYELEFVSRPE